LAREWLGLDTPADYFGRFLLGQRGVDALLQRATIEHTDDRPRLEFVAARRFLDGRGTGGVIDSLILMRQPADAGERGDPALLAKALSTRPADRVAVPYVEAVFASRPGDPEWATRTALARLGRGDTAGAEASLRTALSRGRYPRAVLTAGLIAARRGEADRARSLLGEALARGADTAVARAALAAVSARAQAWAAVERDLAAALAAGAGTFRHPFPRDFLAEALTALALDGPPASAARLVDAAVALRPGWARLYELGAIAALRGGHCAAAAAGFQTLSEFGITRSDALELVNKCRRAVAR
jgi:hypothetical protein